MRCLGDPLGPCISMPDIMIRCCNRAVIVSTGLSTNTVQFELLPDRAVPLQCHACGKTHHWRPRDAWVHGRNDARQR